MKLFILYDERANYNVNEAAVLSMASSLKEALRDRKTMFPNAVIYEYDVKEHHLLNGRLVEVA